MTQLLITDLGVLRTCCVFWKLAAGLSSVLVFLLVHLKSSFQKWLEEVFRINKAL